MENVTNNSIYDILEAAATDNLSYSTEYIIGYHKIEDHKPQWFNETLVRKLLEEGCLVNIPLPEGVSMSMRGWYSVGLTPKGEEMLNALA